MRVSDISVRDARHRRQRSWLSGESDSVPRAAPPTAHDLLTVRGAPARTLSRDRRPMWRPRYAKRESMCLPRAMYYAPDVCCLWRKRTLAERFLRPLGQAASRARGRPRGGWLYN